MHLCDQSLVTLIFLREKSQLEFYKDLIGETDFFCGMVLVQVQKFGTVTRHCLKTFQQCGKRITKTK